MPLAAEPEETGAHVQPWASGSPATSGGLGLSRVDGWDAELGDGCLAIGPLCYWRVILRQNHFFLEPKREYLSENLVLKMIPSQ